MCSRKSERQELTEFRLRFDQQTETLINVYLLADKLQDLATANIVIDELIRYGLEAEENPGFEAISIAYSATIHGSPLRRLLRGYHVHGTFSVFYMNLHVNDFPCEFYRDVAAEFLRAKDDNSEETVGETYGLTADVRYAMDRCHYHQHDDKHPRCVPRPAVADTES